MAASSTDLFKKGARKWVGQIGAGGVSDAVVTTIPLSSATGLPTDTAVEIVIDRVDSSGTKTPSLEETVVGVVSGSNLVTSTRGVEGTAQAHLAGAVVEVVITADMWNDVIDGILVGHGQDGVHSSGLALTSPKITTAIADSAGNEIIKVTATASAVNEITLANAATAGNPVLSATGGDTDIGMDIKMKGAGRLRKPSIFEIQVVDAAVSTSTGDAKAFFRIPAELNGMNLTGVAGSVYTAGTTNTTDIQIRNKTDSVDMLSTKLTIDSAETDSSTAAAAAVIDTTKDDVATGDILAIDVDAVSTTAAKGLLIELRFELP
ncbi:MAG: hypothetical protein WC648_04620 [Candidatus Paceibacterota bacterium]|jgi:hypothetical protein